MKISDEFLELACKALLYSNCETEEDFKIYKAMCDACQKYGVSVKKYIDVTADIINATKEKENKNG